MCVLSSLEFAIKTNSAEVLSKTRGGFRAGTNTTITVATPFAWLAVRSHSASHILPVFRSMRLHDCHFSTVTIVIVSRHYLTALRGFPTEIRSNGGVPTRDGRGRLSALGAETLGSGHYIPSQRIMPRPTLDWVHIR